MAKLTKESKATIGMGILAPQLSYRWRLRFPGNTLTTEEHNRVACQALSVNVDYAKRELTIVLQQDAITTLLHEAIIKMFDKNTVVLHVDGIHAATEEPEYILEYTCKAKEHSFKLDYASNKIANHHIVLDIVSFLPYNNKDNLDIATPSIEVKEEIDA